MSRLQRILRKVFPPRAETSAMGVTVLLAGAVGVGAALLALATERGIVLLSRQVFGQLYAAGAALPARWRFASFLLRPAALAAALVVVAYVIRRWAPEARGMGIGQVMSAVGRRGGYLRGRLIGVKPLVTILSIGAGAPLGLEGPVVQSGAALGSAAGRRFKMGTSNVRILAAAGAAAGLAAKYGAPIGGAVFSAELVLGSTSPGALLPLMMASFLAVATRNAVLRGAPEYVIAVEVAPGLLDYALLALLGVACGIAATYFIKLIFATEDAMERVLEPWWAKALFGGLVIGIAGSMAPELLGTGKPVIQQLLRSPTFPVRLLVIFVLARPLLSSVALAARASGGVFAPSLFAGAALGALCARLAADVLGLQMASSSCYVMAGMAGVMGAVMRAPLQAILVTFELTHNYAMVPSLMLTCVISMKVSELFEAESAFTRRLVRAGERIRQGMDLSLLEGLTVSDVMSPDHVALPASATIDRIDEAVRRSDNRTFPVVDAEGRLVGLVMLGSLMAAGVRAETTGRVARVEELLEPALVHLAPEDTLADAWQVMGNYDYDCLPVCRAGAEGPALIGVCEKEAISEMHDRQSFISLRRGA